MSNGIKLSGVLAKGYGLAPKSVMTDTSLSSDAKVIYCYLSSFCGNGTTAFPGVDLITHHLGMSEKRFYKYRKELTDKGYITIHKRRNGNRWESNLYELNMNLEHGRFECVQTESVQGESVQNVGANSNSLNNNSVTNNSIEDTKPESAPYEQIKDLYNNTCTSLSNVRSLSDTRKKHIRARWQQFNCEIGTFKEIFYIVENSKFLTGNNDRKWKADLDWLIKNDTNMLKVLEGKYSDKGGNQNGADTKDDQYDLEKHGIGFSM